MAKTARKAEDHTPPIQTGQGATHVLLRGGHVEGQDLEAEGLTATLRSGGAQGLVPSATPPMNAASQEARAPLPRPRRRISLQSANAVILQAS